MAFRDVVQHVKRAVVGLGILRDPADEFSTVILGTGFFVHLDGWIMTNRHVLELFVGEREGRVGIHNAVARAVVFADAAGRNVSGPNVRAVGGTGMISCPIIEGAFPPQPPGLDLHYEGVPDLAVCRIDAAHLRQVAPIHHVELADSDSVREGDDVGTCGFPLGLEFPQDGRLRQMTPILQRGIVAAVLPFPGVRNPHAFQLDIHINPGSSGSPLFRGDDGGVVGIIFAAPQRREEVVVSTAEGQRQIGLVALPTGFGYAVPSNRYRAELQRGQRTEQR